jgi:hypothetical protein
MHTSESVAIVSNPFLWLKISQTFHLFGTRKKLSGQWKESIIIQFHTKGEETGRSNYRGLSLLSTKFTVMSTAIVPRLSPYRDETTRYSWKELGPVIDVRPF